ncbi:hypothetical protein GQ473_03255 [archaeon]|nr:hypothetical protein [archaeon]
MTCKFYNDSCSKCMNIKRIGVASDGLIVLHPCYPGTDDFRREEECEYYKKK